MTIRGPVHLARSRLATCCLWGGFPAAALLLLAAAWQGGNPWTLMALVPLAILAVIAARDFQRVRGLDLRPRGLFLDLGDGCWRSARPVGEARISGLAISVPCRLLEGRRNRIRLNVWRDSVDDRSYRRLARIARHGRWPDSGTLAASDP